jgi:imidazole glycerol phosphate synthase glutamine amidotransferase subunit
VSGARPEVVVVRTGTANLASVLAALERLGATASVSEEARLVERAERLVLPGVGAFGAAAERLAALGLIAPLRERILRGGATLAVCLGLQLFAESSEESPGAAGLGAIAGRVLRFSDQVRVPQIGWNRIEAEPSAQLLESGHAYFANSYRLVEAPPGWSAAWADHGGRFVAAIERGRVLACQFHPELSGAFGLLLLGRWLRAGEG